MKNHPFQPLFGGEDSSKLAEMVKSLNEMKARGNRVSKKRTKPVLPQSSPTPIIQTPKNPRSLAGLGQFAGLLQNKKILMIGALLLLILIIGLLVYKQQEQKKKLLVLAKQLKKLKHAR